MKKTAGLLIATATLLLAPTVKAQVFYEYPTALPVEVMRFTVGPYLAAGDDKLFRMGGFGRWGLADHLDLGFELLGESADGDGRFGAGVDAKLSLLPTIRAMPIDLSANVGVGFISSEGLTILQFPIGGIVSIPLQLESGRDLVPYLGVYLLIVNQDIDTGAGTVTDFDAELRPGISVGINENADGFAAFHLGRDGLFSFGLVLKL